MSKEREYKYLDIKALDEADIKPVCDPPEEVLEGGLTDIIQLAQSGGMTDDVVDRVLSRIIEARAQRNRDRFTLHMRED
jgi:hypothetical protein